MQNVKTNFGCTYQSIDLRYFVPNGVPAKVLRAFFDLALKRDLETLCERICSLGTILDLACELEDIFAHSGHLRFILTIGMRCFKFDFEQVANHIFIIFTGPLQWLSERCEYCV